MGRSQETFNKKEVRSKKDKKRKEKEQKRAKRKDGKKSSFDDMIAYVDEFGKITSTPPDPNNKLVISADSIDLGNTRNTSESTQDYLRKGVIIKYSESKGYGFIRDLETQKSYFVHASNIQDRVSENNIVIFEIGRGAKGPAAMNVKLVKEQAPEILP